MLSKKKNVFIIAGALFLVVNIVFFTTLGQLLLAHLVTYGFVTFALLTMIAMPFIEKGHEERLKVSMFTLAVCYFVVEILIALVLIFLTGVFSFILGESLFARILVIGQILLAIVYIAFLISTYFTNIKTEHEMALRDQGICFVKSCSARIKPLLSTIEDKAVRKHVENAYDEVSTSPVASLAEVIEVEEEIQGKSILLVDAAREKDNERIVSLADEIIALVKARNETLKLCH